MQGKRTPTDKKYEVVKKKLQDPNISLREIEADTGVHYKTAGDIINRIPKEVIKSNNEKSMIEKLDNIIDDILEITNNNIRKYKENDKEFGTKELKDLSGIAKETFDRKQILSGKPTDITRVDLDFSKKTLKEMEEIRKELLG